MPDLAQILMLCPGAATLPGVQVTPPEPGQAMPSVSAGPQTRLDVPILTCDVFANTALANGIPLPGSPEFCHVIGQYQQAFAAVAASLLDWFPKLNPLTKLDQLALLPVATGPAGPVYNTIIGIWNGLVHKTADTANFAVQSIVIVFKELLAIHQCLYKRYQPTALLGIWTIRTLVHSLQKIRGGWDIAVWLTVDITLDFRSIDRILDMLEEYFAPMEIPETHEATEAWLLNLISTEQRDCIWQLHGLAPETFLPFAMARKEKVEWKEAIQFVRRKRLGEEAERTALRARGFVTDDDIDVAREMYWELPTIADHLHWLQRQVFDTEYVERYKLMQGFDEKFWPAFGPDLTALGMRKEYAEKHYAAHWIMPSPEQMKRFLYRTEEIAEKTGDGFSLEDFGRILAEQDFNVLARGWFMATAYEVPAISYVKEWYRQGLINKEQLQKYHRWLGFNPEDAELFAEVDDLQKKRMRASQTHGWTTKAATDAWLIGQIGEGKHEFLYAYLGYDKEEAALARQVARYQFDKAVFAKARGKVLSNQVSTVESAVKVGVMSKEDAVKALVDSGWPKHYAEAHAEFVDATAKTGRVQQAITYVKRMVLNGVIVSANAREELIKLGLVPDAADNYVNQWRLLMTPGRKRRTAQQTTNDLAAGHIDEEEAKAILHNLGYDDYDTRLYLADAQGKMTKSEAARIKAEQRSGLARAKEEERVRTEMDRQVKKLVVGMRRQLPVTTLKKWAKMGLIGRDFFERRMLLYGYRPEDIERHYVEACRGKGASCVDSTAGEQGEATAGNGEGPPVA